MDQNFEDMTPAERVLHVQDLWDRIAEHPDDVEVSAAWKAELDRRLSAHRADPSAAIPWERVKANVLARR
jgi:putative addiction module component (TIGR02574 family)